MFSLQNNNSVFTDFDLTSGHSKSRKPKSRYLSEMKGMFCDKNAYDKQLAIEDKLMYQFYDMEVPKNTGNVAYGTSIVYAGTIGNEFIMTKGHFHTVLDTGEVYYCLSGEGLMMMENPEGDIEVQRFTPGHSVYVPGRYAHRSINIGNETLVTFYAFPGHAGHNYGTIEEKGFRKLIIKEDNKAKMIDNPNWINN